MSILLFDAAFVPSAPTQQGGFSKGVLTAGSAPAIPHHVNDAIKVAMASGKDYSSSTEDNQALPSENRDALPQQDMNTLPSENRDALPPQGQQAAPHFLELKVPPALLALLFAVVMWAIDRYHPVFAIEIPFQWPIVLFLSVTAALVGGYSLYLFAKARTTVHAHKPVQTTSIVTTGPYRHTRNPMYLALSLMLIAWAIALSDLLALMIMPGFYLYMSRFQIEPEERVLRDRFGREYEEYCAQTPRWL